MTQRGLPLPGVRPAFEIGDELDRCFTPQPLADAVVRWLMMELAAAGEPMPLVIVEPSVGDGSFVRSCRRAWPAAFIVGCDIDPDAQGLKLVDQAVVGDWVEMAAQVATYCQGLDMGLGRSWVPGVDLVIGNPPFGEAVAHWLAGPAAGLGSLQAMIMPWGYPGVKSWREPFEVAKPSKVRPILGRPWPKRVRETAVYCRASGHDGATELVLPALGWQRPADTDTWAQDAPGDTTT